jgi:hypothetical protein
VQTSDAPIAFTDEATTADATLKRFTITDAVERYWDKNTDVVVKKNNAAITAGFHLEYAGGVVVFDEALLGTDSITVSGKYVTVAQAGGMFNWSVDLSIDTQEKTTFVSGDWKEYEATIAGFSGSAEAYWGDDQFFQALGTEVILALYINETGPVAYEGYAIIAGDGITADVNELIQEDIEFTGDGPVYLRG